jgi:hypothetical protein
MSMNGSRAVQAAYTLDNLPSSLIQVVTEWMQAIGTKELTFSLHENKLTIKSTNFYRTTI